MRTGVIQESYGELISLFRNPTQIYWTWALAIISLAAPLLLTSHVTSMVNGMMIAAVGVIGLNLLTGTTGLISFGHAGFLAVGGYTAAILSADYGIALWLCLPAGGLMAAEPVGMHVLGKAFFIDIPKAARSVKKRSSGRAAPASTRPSAQA